MFGCLWAHKEERDPTVSVATTARDPIKTELSVLLLTAELCVKPLAK